MTFYWQMKSRWPPPGFAQLVASNSVTLPKKGGRGQGAFLNRLFCLIRVGQSLFPTLCDGARGRLGVEGWHPEWKVFALVV